MRIWTIGVMVLGVAACGPGSRTPPCGNTSPACVCDCPGGPPAPPAIDTFCAPLANDGATCCRKLDGSEVGTCVAHECAPL